MYVSIQLWSVLTLQLLLFLKDSYTFVKVCGIVLVSGSIARIITVTHSMHLLLLTSRQQQNALRSCGRIKQSCLKKIVSMLFEFEVISRLFWQWEVMKFNRSMAYPSYFWIGQCKFPYNGKFSLSWNLTHFSLPNVSLNCLCFRHPLHLANNFVIILAKYELRGWRFLELNSPLSKKDWFFQLLANCSYRLL